MTFVAAKYFGNCLRSNCALLSSCLKPVSTFRGSCFTQSQPRKAISYVTAMASRDWVKEDQRRMLHAVYRVGNLNEQIDYYKKHFGLELLRYRDVPEEKYTNAVLGIGPEERNFAVELTYNYGVDSYDLGEGFGHFALGVDDVYKTVAKIKAEGGMITRDAAPIVPGSPVVVAFVKDPSGYSWEIQPRPGTKEPICQVMLRVMDLDKSIKWYQEVLGMKLLRKIDVEVNKNTLAFLGYEDDEKNTAVFELAYNWERTEPYKKGNGYAQTAISTKDVYKTAEAIKAAGGTLTREPGPLPGLGTKITATTDPDGWKVVFVDEADFFKEIGERQ